MRVDAYDDDPWSILDIGATNRPVLKPKPNFAAAGGGVQTYAQLEVDRDWWREAYLELLETCGNLITGVVRACEGDVDIDKITDPNEVNN